VVYVALQVLLCPALKLNQEALELNRNELAISNEQLGLSAKAHVEIEKTQKIQQFDMLFATLLNELNTVNKNFNEKKLLDEFYLIFNNTLTLEHKQVELRKKYLLTRYFILLYQSLKLISSNEFLIANEKKKYSNILRASIENSLLQLLMLNCHCNGYEDDFNEFYDFLKEFSFLEHMDFSHQYSSQEKHNFDLILCLRNYDKKVFGKNIYISEVKKLWYYKIFNKNDKIETLEELFNFIVVNNYIENKITRTGFEFEFKFTSGRNEIIKKMVICIKEIDTGIIKEFMLNELEFEVDDIKLVAKNISSDIDIYFNYGNHKLELYVRFNYPEMTFKESGFSKKINITDLIKLQ